MKMKMEMARIRREKVTWKTRMTILKSLKKKLEHFRELQSIFLVPVVFIDRLVLYCTRQNITKSKNCSFAFIDFQRFSFDFYDKVMKIVLVFVGGKIVQIKFLSL